MGVIESAEATVLRAIGRYIETQVRYARPISTCEAVMALRSVLPKCYLADRELAELVAAMAIGRGLDVTFDCSKLDEPGSKVSPPGSEAR
jgi:hypothetical protein